MKKVLLGLAAIVIVGLVIIKFAKRNGQSFEQYSDSLAVINEKKMVADEKEKKPFNVQEIIRKTPQEIEKVYGKPIKKDEYRDLDLNCNSCPVYTYSNTIEIVYINGKSDWITLNNLAGAPFENCSIDLVGPYDCTNRTFKSDHVIRWNNIPDIKEVLLFQKKEDGRYTGKIKYGYVKVVTP